MECGLCRNVNLDIFALTTVLTVLVAGEHQDHQRQPRRGGRPAQRQGGVGETAKRENSKQQQQQQHQQQQQQRVLQLPPA